MPANTPVYGFTYPCDGEAITPATFATLANQIDAKLADVNADRLAALGRRNTDIALTVPAQNIAAGVETVLTVPGSTYTIPAGAAGIWEITVTVVPLSTPATANMVRARIMQNAVKQTSYTFNPEPNSPQQFSVTAPIIGAAGDVLTTSLIYNGTGTMDVSATLSVKLICRIA